ncbi:hypothetical protein PIB30_036094 [Stylosanthes scabra]|uniref:Uncharacterized protein n=1 Tax=Stylosanthes scabra TaxID=79078 RepID=A0ABU6TDJ8_9FABA|nr:hypothetical protein [Stylosanthes scabra]
MEKQTKLDRLKSMMVDVSKMGPHAILPAPMKAGVLQTLPGPHHPLNKKVPPPKPVPETICIDGEEGVKQDPAADLKQKRQKRKHKDIELASRMLGDDSKFNYREALDAGITSASVRKPLLMMPPEQLLGTTHQYGYKSIACLQVGLNMARI